MSTSTATSRTAKLPSAPVLIGAVYATCVLALDAVFIASIIFGAGDPHRSEGPIEELILVSVFGTAALLVGVGLLTWLGRTTEGARISAIVLAALSVMTLVFFWSGAPGILGACAAAAAGLTRGRLALGGAARVAGIVGVFIALLNVVITVGGTALAQVFG